ncbi:hypothetical protein AMATHDRAFT_11536 [Amanita thiersii Skay4041]|uniref:Uncharacterized protein n=1 Tax=Amanita thiersii Skay4041 TaxID=703135 RepID=A0A2A9N9X7_9AGAR|nr:hypothetical protein AMATHDRAFT_11536 [Amanita thiersii Skay4041]
MLRGVPNRDQIIKTCVHRKENHRRACRHPSRLAVTRPVLDLHRNWGSGGKGSVVYSETITTLELAAS